MILLGTGFRSPANYGSGEPQGTWRATSREIATGKVTCVCVAAMTMLTLHAPPAGMSAHHIGSSRRKATSSCKDVIIGGSVTAAA